MPFIWCTFYLCFLQIFVVVRVPEFCCCSCTWVSLYARAEDVSLLLTEEKKRKKNAPDTLYQAFKHCIGMCVYDCWLCCRLQCWAQIRVDYWQRGSRVHNNLFSSMLFLWQASQNNIQIHNNNNNKIPACPCMHTHTHAHTHTHTIHTTNTENQHNKMKPHTKQTTKQ